jgi:hypothetical protein
MVRRKSSEFRYDQSLWEGHGVDCCAGGTGGDGGAGGTEGGRGGIGEGAQLFEGMKVEKVVMQVFGKVIPCHEELRAAYTYKFQ